MEQMIKCPYCGEEIKAEAKKCRHCGEWLNGMPSSEKVAHSETTSQVMTNTDKINGALLLSSCLACWAAIVLEIVSSIQTWQENSDREIGGFIGWIVRPIVNNVPDWSVILVLGILWVVLLMGLRSFCRMKGITKIPFIALACLMIGCYFFSLIACFVEDEEIIGALFLFTIPMLIATSILEFIAGIKLCNSKITHALGILFMASAIFPIIAFIVETGLLGVEGSGLISTLVECLISIYLLVELYKLFNQVGEDEVEE